MKVSNVAGSLAVEELMVCVLLLIAAVSAVFFLVVVVLQEAGIGKKSACAEYAKIFEVETRFAGKSCYVNTHGEWREIYP